MSYQPRLAGFYTNIVAGFAADIDSGFISGAQALSSGCYDKRVAQKEAKLSRAKSLTDQLKQENKQLEVKKTQTSAGLVRMRQQIAALEKDNAKLGRTLSTLKSTSTTQAAVKKKLEARLKTLNESLVNAEGSSKDEADLALKIEALRKERDQLADEIAEATASG